MTLPALSHEPENGGERPPIYKFRLYTAADSASSALAYANLLIICKTHLEGRHTIEVIDVVRQPQRALSDGIRMTPTLLKVAPEPTRTIVGTLLQTERVLLALGIDVD